MKLLSRETLHKLFLVVGLEYFLNQVGLLGFQYPFCDENLHCWRNKKEDGMNVKVVPLFDEFFFIKWNS